MKISVIIPAYNCERFIARAIESVKRQTFADLECIVIDDCSTDGTYYTALEAIGDDLRFSAYSLLDNMGIARARNRGISFSKSSDALFFLDADDWLDRNCLEMLIAESAKFPTAGRIFTPPVREFQNGWPSRPWRVDMNGLYGKDDQSIFSGRFFDLGHCTGALYIKKNIKGHLVFPEDVWVFEDMIMNMGLIMAGTETAVVQKHPYHYLAREGSILTSYPFSYRDAEAANNALAVMAKKYNAPEEMRLRFQEFLGNAIGSQLARRQQKG